jgi:WXXGXW repeat (2 copies)
MEVALKSTLPTAGARNKSPAAAIKWLRIGSLALPALAATLFLGVASPAFSAIGIDIQIAPPPPPPNIIVPAPRVGFVWAPGYWQWNGQRHVWVEGRWLRAHPGHHWVPEHWVEHHGHYRFVRGHWARG